MAKMKDTVHFAGIVEAWVSTWKPELVTCAECKEEMRREIDVAWGRGVLEASVAGNTPIVDRQQMDVGGPDTEMRRRFNAGDATP